MRARKIFSMAGALMVLLTGCGSHAAEYPDVRYVRSYSSSHEKYPSYRIAKTRDQFEEYIRQSGCAFLLNEKGYDDVFFNVNNLVMVLLDEGSGSVKHKVVGVTPGRDTLEVAIMAILPGGMGTCDMAYWHILIPVAKNIFDGEKILIKNLHA